LATLGCAHALAEPKSPEPKASAPAPGPKTEPVVIQISAHQWAFDPSTITLKKGVPVTLELHSEDRVHGFNAPDFGLRSDVPPGKPVRLTFTPDRTGTFIFHCDVFCGDGHDDMAGQIVVKK
jgi:cytochrome c oxidase subunit 2